MLSRRRVLAAGALSGFTLAVTATAARALSLEPATPEVESALKGVCGERKLHTTIEEEIAALIGDDKLSTADKLRLSKGVVCPICGQRLAGC